MSEKTVASLEAENMNLKLDIYHLLDALKGMVTDEEGDPCWYDHHGYCQAHGVNDPCEMATARRAIKMVAERDYIKNRPTVKEE